MPVDSYTPIRWLGSQPVWQLLKWQYEKSITGYGGAPQVFSSRYIEVNHQPIDDFLHPPRGVDQVVLSNEVAVLQSIVDFVHGIGLSIHACKIDPEAQLVTKMMMMVMMVVVVQGSMCISKCFPVRNW